MFSAGHQRVGSVVVMAEMFGQYRSALMSGTRLANLRASSFAIAGNQVIITCSVPVGSLVLDAGASDGRPANVNSGFAHSDGAGRTITGVAVGGNQIAVTLSGVPGSGAVLSAGYDATVVSGANVYNSAIIGGGSYTPGAWCDVRDSRADACQLVSGWYKRNWLMPFQQALT